MVRGLSAFAATLARFPHARGDGPVIFGGWLVIFTFSPRPWGWSEFKDREKFKVTVFPTPVGMVRIS